MIDLLEDKRQAIAETCLRHGVARLDVFGSAQREDFRPGESDLDLLLKLAPMEPHARIDACFRSLDDLQALLGQEVDPVLAGEVKNRHFAQEIAKTKRTLYAA